RAGRTARARRRTRTRATRPRPGAARPRAIEGRRCRSRPDRRTAAAAGSGGRTKAAGPGPARAARRPRPPAAGERDGREKRKGARAARPLPPAAWLLAARRLLPGGLDVRRPALVAPGQRDRRLRARRRRETDQEAVLVLRGLDGLEGHARDFLVRDRRV